MNTEHNLRSLSVREKVQYIRREIMREGDQLRAQYPILMHKDAIAVVIMIGSIAGMALTGWSYVANILPAWLVIPIIAIFASFTHELEHDLIHWMYFKDKRWAHNLMLALGLLARPTTVRPWVRRAAHLNHHQHSGTEQDIEERAITNGQKWNLLRLLMLLDLPFAIAVHALAQPGWKNKLHYVGYVGGALLPLGVLSWGIWYAFLGVHLVSGIASLSGHALNFSITAQSVIHVLNIAVVVLVAPNILRTFCLNFLSSNMHYYGDIDADNLIQETQVLNAWWLFPLQLFSFNVGATHGIHHYVVREPFWIRQMTVHTAHKVMRECGVRFNDFGTFSRANRWRSSETKQIESPAAVAL